MSIKRWSTKRDANEPQIIAALVKAGAKVIQLDEPVDLIVWYRLKLYLLEVKVSEKAKLTRNQRDLLSTNPGLFDVVWDEIMALRAIGATSY